MSVRSSPGSKMAGVRSLAASKQGVRGCASKRCTIPLAYCSPTNVACAVKPRLVPRSAGSSSAPTTDATVPEGHRGLHSALYDRDAADVHGSVGGYRPVDGEDDGGALLELQAYVAAREGAKPTGVFALYDTARNLQYVGYRCVVRLPRPHAANVLEQDIPWPGATLLQLLQHPVCDAVAGLPPLLLPPANMP